MNLSPPSSTPLMERASHTARQCSRIAERDLGADPTQSPSGLRLYDEAIARRAPTNPISGERWQVESLDSAGQVNHERSDRRIQSTQGRETAL